MNLGEIRRQHCLDCRAIQRKTAEKALQCQCIFRELREAHDRTTRCYAPVDSTLAGLAFSGRLPASGCAANSSFIIHHS